MSALGQQFQLAVRRLLAGKRLIALPIPDIQHENPRDVCKGRLLTPICLSPMAASGCLNRGLLVIVGAEAGNPTEFPSCIIAGCPPVNFR